MKYLIFIDIDGVLTSNRAEFSDGLTCLWNKFDPIAIDFFNRIHDTYDEVEFVLISTWRDWLDTNNSAQFHWVTAAFRSAGFRGNFSYPNWKVNPDNNVDLWNKRRAYEIQDYLANHAPGCKDFIIFDDSDYNFNKILGVKRFVKTDADNGVMFKHMRNAWALMGLWDKRIS